MEDCPSDNNSDEPFFMCQIQGKQVIASLHKERSYLNLLVPTCAHHKKLTYLKCTLHTAGDVNVTPANVYKQLYYDYSMIQFGPVQANLNAYSSTGMKNATMHKRQQKP